MALASPHRSRANALLWAAACVAPLGAAAGELAGPAEPVLTAPPLCESSALPPPRRLLERFINADCEACWREPSAAAGSGTLAVDWVVPGAQGDEAPLAAVARRDALARLAALHATAPATSMVHGSKLHPQATHPVQPLRVAHGVALGGYIGASLQWRAAAPTPQRPLTAWLALVEVLPKGSEGSPVERHLVRNLIVAPLRRGRNELGGAAIWRVMNVPDGARPERLEVAGWVADAQGRIVAAAQSRCPAPQADAGATR